MTGMHGSYMVVVALADSRNRPSQLSDTRYYWAQSVSESQLITLPNITDMTELSMNVQWNFDINHPRHDSNYPLIPTRSGSFRVRNLALGGPFQPEIDYRKEIAGALHYQKRCQICAAPIGGALRPFRKDFDVLFCRWCQQKYTLSKPNRQDLLH